MCGLTRAGGLKSSKIAADAKANRPAHVPQRDANGKEQISFSRPDTNLAKGWGYNAFSVPSVPMPKKEDKKLKDGEDDDFGKPVMDENGNYPFSMPDASEGI